MPKDEYRLCAKCDHFVEPNEIFEYDKSVTEFVHLDDGEQEFDHDATPLGAADADKWERMRPDLFKMHPDGKVGPNSRYHSQRGKVAPTCEFRVQIHVDGTARTEQEARDVLEAFLSYGVESYQTDDGGKIAKARIIRGVGGQQVRTVTHEWDDEEETCEEAVERLNKEVINAAEYYVSLKKAVARYLDTPNATNRTALEYAMQDSF